MFIVRKPKENVCVLPIRRATAHELLIYEKREIPDNEDITFEDYITIRDQLKDYSQRIEALEGTSATATKISYINLLANAWEGTASPYSQVVDIDGITENSRVDLTPSIEQLSIFYDKSLAFVTENIDGVVTVYAVGQKPMNDYVVQVSITEVDV